ncbi:MAG: FAD-dependent oxidoreductase [SAR202 cluster bacterium]|jgi:glycine oxidase|nr:FAD-dependent oxidoreductase [SAR202 cluster bacterium]
MKRNPDVVIIGAGVAGCATAYYLAREGVNTLVLERDAIGSHASGFALGLLNPLTGTRIPSPIQPLAETAFEMHKGFWSILENESDMKIQVRLMPHLELFMTAEEEANQQDDMDRWAATEGFITQRLEPKEVFAIEPRITRDLYSAVLLERVGVLDSYRYTLALAQAAEHHGAKFATGIATGLVSSGNKITGVELEQDTIDCETVVLALGPWSGQASSWLGFDIPISPLKGEIIYLEGFETPMDYHVHGACSIVTKVDGLTWIAATEESAGFDETTSNSARDELMRSAMSMIPNLGDLRLIRQTACLRPITPDSGPILGKAPGWEGVYLATGAEKKGILISPVIGKGISDLILRGKTEMPIGSFNIERFIQEG